jgi:hypothetical protein
MVDTDKIIKEYGFINFKILTEDWSEYLLEDRSLLRIKTIPLKILFSGEEYGINSTNCLVTFSPRELKGEPSNEPIIQSEIKNSFDKSDLKFEVRNEPWNEYELEDGTKIFLKMVAVQVSRTKFYDAYGDPIYWINHQMISKKYPI